MKTKIIDCRNTGQGAYTATSELEYAEVDQFGRSKSGNHWKEKITFLKTSSSVFVIDISNSGKHRCYRLMCNLDHDGNLVCTEKRESCGETGCAEEAA